MTPELLAVFILVSFGAGCLFCWPLAYRRGKIAAARDHWRMDIDLDEDWDL